MNCGVDRRHSLDSALLWLWCKPAAIALIRPLAWEFPYAMGAALKRKKKKKVAINSHTMDCVCVEGNSAILSSSTKHIQACRHAHSPQTPTK